MSCPHCGTNIQGDARFCPGCGQPGNLDGAAGHSRETLLLAAIGPGAEKYLPEFLAREQGLKGAVGWHWPALFVTFFWMLHRKMYGLALAYLGIALLLTLIVAPTLTATSGTVGAVLAGLIYLGLAVIPALYAGVIYHRHCRQVIAFTQRYQPEPQRQLRQIELSGGTGGAIVPLIGLFACVPLLGILAAIALPAYQDYNTRAATTAAYGQLRDAGTAVSNHYSSHGRLPASLEEAGVSEAPTERVSHLKLENDGVLTAILAEPPAIAGKILQLLPALNDQGSLDWTCHGEAIPDRHLPRPCKFESNE